MKNWTGSELPRIITTVTYSLPHPMEVANALSGVTQTL